MQSWLEEFNNEDVGDDAIAKAAKLYWQFQNIHPFEDGNGRIGRVLLAYWLHWKKGLDWHFYARDKLAHLNALGNADQGNFEPLIDFVRERAQQNR